MQLTTGEIASRLQGTLSGDSNTPISGIAPTANARQGQIAFAENRRHFRQAIDSEASAVIVGRDLEPPPDTAKAVIQVAQARVGFAELIDLFHPESLPPPGIHASSVVHPEAQIDPSASIGPGCLIGSGTAVEANVVLHGGNQIGNDCRLGESCQLFPRVVLYPRSALGKRVRIHAGAVIGSDGYGYIHDGKRHRKIQQVGGVNIGDDVEIGANTTVDRGALDDTVIGEGTKIDNLVQIAHNVVIGKHCLIIAQTGIAGSTKIGNGVTIAGQVGIAGHLHIGDGATIAAQSGVMRDIPGNQTVFGTPAQEDRKVKRQILALQKLPELLRQLRTGDKTPRPSQNE